MDDLLDGQFYNPTKGSLSLPKVMEELICYMKEKPERNYEMIVGCDSSANEDPTFPVVVVMLRRGEGGRFFLKRIHYPERKFYNRHERILEEVMLSCKLALWLRENFTARMKEEGANNLNYQFLYIHADVGENGLTKDMVKEVAGLIRGNGFEPVVKPESFAASKVADRFS